MYGNPNRHPIRGRSKIRPPDKQPDKQKQETAGYPDLELGDDDDDTGSDDMDISNYQGRKTDKMDYSDYDEHDPVEDAMGFIR
mmetsp:Transcript_24947/g.44360  ORF Transcript_24947/g.44360 Transcript_24947/m.44360 type:complete len:83 (+) Transcript_24947:247-495(+)